MTGRKDISLDSFIDYAWEVDAKRDAGSKLTVYEEEILLVLWGYGFGEFRYEILEQPPTPGQWIRYFELVRKRVGVWAYEILLNTTRLVLRVEDPLAFPEDEISDALALWEEELPEIPESSLLSKMEKSADDIRFLLLFTYVFEYSPKLGNNTLQELYGPLLNFPVGQATWDSSP